MRAETKNFLIMMSLVGVFAVPLGIAVFLNSTWSDWRPQSTRNFGRLVEPPAAVPVLGSARTEQTGPDDRRWTLMFVTRACAPPCLEQLMLLRQVHRTLGNDAGRLQRILVAEDTLSDSARQLIRDEMPELLAFEGTGEAWLSSLRDALGEDPRERAFIVDPRGAIVLSYAAALDPSGLHKDLSHLLKWSR